MIESVIPISNREPARRNMERLDLLLKSLNFFWRGDHPFVVHLIAPDAEFDEISTCVASLQNKLLNIDLRIRTETSVSPVIASVMPAYGVMKQMLIKLSCFNISDADYVIILDSDIVACKPFGYDDLVRNGKVLTEWLTPTLGEWWMESARVLDYSIGEKDFSEPRIFVTPQILCKPILTGLLDRISDVLSADWLLGLISEYSGNHPHIWTEYTLYDLFADRNNIRDKYHLGADECGGDRLQCMDQSIWGPSNYPGWNPAAALDGSSVGYFMVLQSITADSVDFDDVKRRWLEAASAAYIDYIR